MTTLLIDTATERSFIALFEKTTLVEERLLPTGLHSSRHLIPELEAMLKDNRPKKIVVGVGPGSYTGIRVGVAVARSLAYGWQIPLVGVSSLCSFVPSEPGEFATVVDARVGGFYIQLGTKKGEHIEWEGECQLIPQEDWTPLLDHRMIVTPYAALVKQRLPNKTINEVAPNPLALLWEANTHPRSDTILYLRKTQAEQELKGKK